MIRIPTLLLLSAGICISSQAQASTETPPAARHAKAKAKTAWVHVASKHNGSGVRLAYSVPSMQPGRTSTVLLRFSGVQGDDARVEWRAPEGASVTSAVAGSSTGMALPRGQVTTLTLDVTPAADGMAYLDVFTTQNGRGSAQSVPLKVGSGKVFLKREGTLQTMPSGEAVISLPSSPK